MTRLSSLNRWSRWLLAALLALGMGCASDDAAKTPAADTGAEQGAGDDAGLDAGEDATVEEDAKPDKDTGPQSDTTVDSGPTGPWQQMANPTKMTLNDIWGTSADNIYAVGKGGIIIHWDGKLWEAMNNTETADLYGIYGVDENTIFAVGDGIALVYTLDKCLTASSPDAGVGGDAGPPPDPCPPGQYCDKDGYCKPGAWKEAYSSSYKSGFRAVWGTAEDNVWAIGLEGTARQKTSSSSYWSSKTTGIDEDFHDLIGFEVAASPPPPPPVPDGGAGDASAADLGIPLDLGAPVDAGGTKMETVLFAVGSNGMIAKYDGDDWTKMPSGVSSDLHSIWGTAPNNLYAAGLDGVVLHYDGTEWKKMNTGSMSYFYGVWGTSANDVWVVGHPVFDPKHSVFHYDGSKWSNMSPEFSAGGLNAIWTNKANEAFVVGNFSLLRYSK